jgi:hypothetical protein
MRLGRTPRQAVVTAALIGLPSCTPSLSPQRPAPPPPSVLGSPRIPDFSFAGYHMGASPLPRVPEVLDARTLGVKGDGVSDDTRALQAALDATHDGAVVLSAGRFVLRDALRQVAVASSRGERRLTVAAAPGATPLRAGDVVRVRMDSSDGLLRWLLGGSLAPGAQTPKDYAHYVDWDTPIAEVRGDTLMLSRPLRVDVRPEWRAEVLSSRPTLEEIGVEDLSFEFPGVARRPHDYAGPTAQSWAAEGFRAVYFDGVTNGWIRNVSIVDADDGIELEECRFCQVQGVHLRAAHRKSPSGHHGLWAKGAQDCLLSDFRIETEFEDDLTVEAFANGNVFMRGVGERMSLDHHRNAPYENLFTDLDVGDGARLWNSGGDANRGPHAGVRETLWNVRHRGEVPPLPGALHYDRPVDAGWPLLNLIRVPGFEPTSERENTWVWPAPDAPANLYEAERAGGR